MALHYDCLRLKNALIVGILHTWHHDSYGNKLYYFKLNDLEKYRHHIGA